MPFAVTSKNISAAIILNCAPIKKPPHRNRFSDFGAAAVQPDAVA
jgi:hypothetical protein